MSHPVAYHFSIARSSPIGVALVTYSDIPIFRNITHQCVRRCDRGEARTGGAQYTSRTAAIDTEVDEPAILDSGARNPSLPPHRRHGPRDRAVLVDTSVYLVDSSEQFGGIVMLQCPLLLRHIMLLCLSTASSCVIGLWIHIPVYPAIGTCLQGSV